MALGHIDYYALKPLSTPDELFHRLVSEFLQEWRRQNAPGRRELTVVADPWSPRGYDAAQPARAERRAACLPRARLRRRALELLQSCGQGGADVPVVILPDGSALVDPARGGPRAARDAHADGARGARAVRRRDRRSRAGRARSRGLRIVGGAERARRRARVDRRPGGVEHAHPQLPRLLARAERRRARSARVPAGVGLRCDVPPHPRGRGIELGDAAHTSRSRAAATSRRAA